MHLKCTIASADLPAGMETLDTGAGGMALAALRAVIAGPIPPEEMQEKADGEARSCES
jgi:hypothetical protein